MPGKRAARPAKPQVRRRWLLGLVGALVLLGAVGALALTLGGSPSSDDRKPTAGGQASSSSKPSDGATSQGGATAKLVRACAAEVSSASAAVEAAAPGVSHWSSHVQARTDMLDGRIPVPAMDAIWKRTRLAGPADQTRFQAAIDTYGTTSHCADLRTASASSGDLAAGCVARSEAATRAVAAAKAAMRDWKSHLANMSMYAHNQMSQNTAQGRWVSAWRNAPTDISAYRSARAALDKAAPCKVA